MEPETELAAAGLVVVAEVASGRGEGVDAVSLVGSETLRAQPDSRSTLAANKDRHHFMGCSFRWQPGLAERCECAERSVLEVWPRPSRWELGGTEHRPRGPRGKGTADLSPG